ncbi:MAG: hypothetical protein WBF33_00805 [Candidatus Nitrosopolaris sp.]
MIFGYKDPKEDSSASVHGSFFIPQHREPGFCALSTLVPEAIEYLDPEIFKVR